MAISDDDVYETIIYKAIWSALEASQDFVDMVKPGNRIKHTIKQGQGIRYDPTSRPVKLPGDLVEVDLDIASFSSSPQMVTFCSSSSRDENHIQNYNLTFQSDDPSVNQILKTKHVVMEALRASGHNLGVTKNSKFGVQGWSIPAATVLKGQPLPGQPSGTDDGRRKIQVTIRVTYRAKK